MHQPVGQLAVVGEQHQAFGIRVEATDVKELLVAANSVFDEISDAWSATVVRHRGMHAARFVQCEIDEGVVEHHPRTVDANHRHVGVHPGAEFRHHLAVDVDATVDDHPLRDAA